MEPIKNEVAVMFSGGIDSLLAAVLLLQTYDKVHLITFDKGYLEFGVKNNIPNVDRLKAKFGADRVHHEIIDLKKIVKRIAYKKLRKDRKKYNLETRWCVGCRLGMNTGGLLYALEHGLVGYADGSNREQIPSEANLTGTAENYPSIVNRNKNFAAEYAVNFLTPTYEYGSREDRRLKLSELGFDIDFLSLDTTKKLSGLMTKQATKRSQPMCFSGWIIHWKRNLLGKSVEQNEEMTVDYVANKQVKVVGQVIRDYFAEKGLDVAQIVKARKADPLGKFTPSLV
ncbi:MAG: 7-cyano-7-deazaguanine synthase [Candidatus Aminicenantales bacterium]|jgi:hypothetical protein